MDLTRIRPTLAVTCTLFLLTACGGKDKGTPTEIEVHDTYLVRLAPADEGAAVLTMPTVGVRTLESVDGQVYFQRVGDELRIMLLRSSSGPLSFRIHLIAAAPAPDIQLQQVAGADNRLRDTTLYQLEITGG